MKQVSYFRTGFFVLVCLVAAGCNRTAPEPAAPDRLSLAERPAPGEVRAGRIAHDEERMRGGAADSAVGDYKLMNHDAVFVIHDVGDSGVYLMNGGALLDADLWRDGESWDLVFNFAPIVSSVYHLEATSVSVESDGSDGEAVLRVDGYFRSARLLAGISGFDLNERKDGLEGTTWYRLRPDSTALEIETVVRNTGAAAIRIPAGDAHIPSDHYGDPFVNGAGFRRDGMQQPTSLIGAVGERNEGTFALIPADGGQYDLPMPANLVIQKDMPVYLAPQIECAAEPGESCGWRRFAVVAESPARARAAVLEREGKTERTLEGRVVGNPSGKPVAGARVFVTPGNDATVILDMDITDADGRFAVHPGAATHVTLHARPTDRGETAVHPGALPPVAQAEGYVAATPLDVLLSNPPAKLELVMGEPAVVTLQLREPGGRKLPGKVTFVAPSGPIGANAAFGESRAYGNSVNQPIEKVAWQAHAEDMTVALAPGTYDIIGSFGIAHELGRQDDVTLGAGEKRTITLELEPAVDLTGWAQCDTHIHTSYSNHGRTSHTDRVITLAAEGLNCAAITDHDRIMDFQPLVRELGLEKTLFTFPALEVSTFLRGHINVYSLIPDTTKPNNGAIAWWEEGNTIPILFRKMRDIGGRVIQINHGAGIGGYFTMTGYNPETGRGGPEFSPKFDVMELVNGKGFGDVPELRDIAFSLWDRGRRKAVVGVSDSHYRIPEPGYARSLVYVGPEWHGAMGEEAVLRGFLAMNAVVSRGVFAEMRIGEARMGATVTGATQQVELRVEAPSWVLLTQAELIWNGQVVQTFDIRGRESDVVRLDVTAPLKRSSDGWVVLQVSGEGDLWPVAPGARPYAMTNPIFIDANGDGWVPPKTPPGEGEIGLAPHLGSALHGHGHGHDHDHD